MSTGDKLIFVYGRFLSDRTGGPANFGSMMTFNRINGTTRRYVEKSGECWGRDFFKVRLNEYRHSCNFLNT